MWRPNAVLLAAMIAAPGCYSGIDGGDSPFGPGFDSGEDESGASSSAGRDDESGGDADPEDDDESEPEVGDCDPGSLRGSTLRRLNRREYRNTVGDLLGLTVEPELLLPWDNLNAHGMDNDGDALALDVTAAEQYYTAAEAVADVVRTDGTAPFSECSALAGEALQSCVADGADAWLQRAFRRPSPEGAKELLLGLVAGATSYDEAAAATVLFTLTSPHFLFHYKAPIEDADSPVAKSFEVADRLAYLVWSSTPDATLINAAEAGELASPSQIKAQVDRMLEAPEASRFYADFSALWLKMGILSEKPDAGENPELFADMQTETRMFFEHVATSQTPLSTLLNARETFVNGRLANYYGIELGFELADDEWMLVPLPATERQGLLTHASVLAASAGTDFSDPIRRGLWISEQIVCLEPPPPPFEPPPLPTPESTGAETVREVLEAHRADPACATCHALIDPYGLGLEKYDRNGVFRENYENGAAIDASGILIDGSEFEDAISLTSAIAEGTDFESCAASFLSSYSVGRALNHEEECFVDLVVDAAHEANGDDVTFRDLLVALVSSYLFVNGEE